MFCSFHSQDSLFRFDASGNLVVSFNELNSQRQNVQANEQANVQEPNQEEENVIEPDFDIQV